MLTLRRKSVEVPKRLPKLSEEERMAQERMRDVLVLLESLFEREETTVKLILDCLYDVGSVNLINKKFPNQPLNGILKSIAKMSKPAFKIYSLWRFKREVPLLLTNWLGGKVKF